MTRINLDVMSKAADAVALSGGDGVRQDIPPDRVQDIRRIPSTFAGHRMTW